MKTQSKIVLFDADSLVYQSIYKVISFGEIREMIESGKLRFEIEMEILQRGYDRFEKISFDIINEIEEHFAVEKTMYFFTKCKRNFRKEIDPEYKANRKKPNRWITELRNYLIKYLDNSFAHDEYEADDLIYYNSQLIDQSEYIICSIDKDLKQIPGIHFDYYQLKQYTEDGEEYKVRKGFKIMNNTDCENLLCELLLTGDSCDNIKGVKGIGEIKAKKIIYSKNSIYGKFRAICEAYKNESDTWKEKLRMNYKLLKFQ
jgi:5'-3' exonuclease